MSTTDRGGERGVVRYQVDAADEHVTLERREWGRPGVAMVLATSYDALAAERDRLVELLRDADLIIEEWIEILKDGNMKCTAIDGEQWRIRPALRAALSGGRT